MTKLILNSLIEPIVQSINYLYRKLLKEVSWTLCIWNFDYISFPYRKQWLSKKPKFLNLYNLIEFFAFKTIFRRSIKYFVNNTDFGKKLFELVSVSGTKNSKIFHIVASFLLNCSNPTFQFHQNTIQIERTRKFYDVDLFIAKNV